MSYQQNHFPQDLTMQFRFSLQFLEGPSGYTAFSHRRRQGSLDTARPDRPIRYRRREVDIFVGMTLRKALQL
jgi:hypothetical protein